MKKYGVIGALIAVALTMAACSSGTNNSSSSNNIQSKVSATQQWKNAHGQDVQTLVNDLNQMQTDANNNASNAQIGADCATLRNDAQQLQSDGPYPDPTKGAILASVLSSLVSGSQACVSAVATDDPSLMQQAIQDFENAMNSLNTAASTA